MSSYWNQHSPLMNSTKDWPATSHEEPVDHLVIGAGLTGASIAYWLVKKYPQQKVLLVDSHYPGFGASGRNAGFLTSGSLVHVSHLINNWGVQFAKERLLQTRSIRKFFRQQHWIKSQEQLGSLTLCNDSSLITPSISLYNEMGWPIENRTHVGFEHCVFDPDEYSIDPISLLSSILTNTHCTKLNNFEVTNLQYDETQQLWNVKARSIDKSFSVQARRVYLSTHTKISDLLPELASEYKPTLNLIGLSEPFEHSITSNVYMPEYLCYLRPISHTQIIIGGLREFTGALETRVNSRIAPIMKWAPLKIHKEWKGEIGLRDHPQPLAYSSGNGLYALGCYSGHGVALSFGAAYAFIQKIELLSGSSQKFDVFTEPTLEYST